MKTWRGDGDLPPSVNDEFITWMAGSATSNRIDRAIRPELTPQHGDENVFSAGDEASTP
jgi:hypothetical protein